MNRRKLREVLIKDGYSKSTVESIMCGRRRPNPEKRYEYEKKYKIPFNVWGTSIKEFLENDTKKQDTPPE